MARSLSIHFSVRAVVARNYAFRPYGGGALSSAEAALDTLAGWPPETEPLVVRVRATGGRADERAQVVGDWLRDASDAPPRRIPPPVWAYDDAARAWARARGWLRAWETCPDARWMLHAAAVARVDRRLRALATCACARSLLERIPDAEVRPRRAVETAEAWARGRATRPDVLRAYHDVYDNLMENCGDGAFYATYACAVLCASLVFGRGESAAYVARVAGDADPRPRKLRELAAVVRRNLPTLDVLRAVTRPPTPRRGSRAAAPRE